MATLDDLKDGDEIAIVKAERCPSLRFLFNHGEQEGVKISFSWQAPSKKHRRHWLGVALQRGILKIVCGGADGNRLQVLGAIKLRALKGEWRLASFTVES